MKKEQIKIADVIPSEYSSFLLFCSESGKVFISELTNIDFVAFRTTYGLSRESVDAIRQMIENPVIKPTNYSVKSSSVKTVPDNDFSNTNKKSSMETTSDDHIGVSKKIGKNKTKTVSTEDQLLSNSSPKDKITDFLTQYGDQKLEDIFNTSASLFESRDISALNLHSRGSNCLKRSNVQMISQLLLMTGNELKAIHNMGDLSLYDIIYKTKEYVTNPINIIDSNKDEIPPMPCNEEKSEVEFVPFETAELLLLEKPYSTEGFSENQILQIDKLKDSIDNIGKEICLRAFYNPKYCRTLCKVLLDYSAPYVQYRKNIQYVIYRISILPKNIKELKAVPFIKAYSAKADNKALNFISECQEETIIAKIPSIIDRYYSDEKMSVIISETILFVEWLNYNIDTLISAMKKDLHTILSGNKEKSLEVFKYRIQGETLEMVGERFGVTRERIRQLEQKAHRVFWKVYDNHQYDLIMLVYALENGNKILHYDDLKDFLGIELADTIWMCIKHKHNKNQYFYSRNLDAIIIKTDNDDNFDENAYLSSVEEILKSIPDVIETIQRDNIIDSIAKSNNFTIEEINNAFDEIYKRTGKFYHKGRLTVSFMCEYVLKKYFQAGYKISDDFETSRFRKYMEECFASRANDITNRAIDANIGNIGVLCDRGKYIHPDYLVINKDIIDTVNNYIDNSSRSILSYGELFENLKTLFEGSQITNRYLLQGALKKYGCRYNTGRDYIRKTKTVSFVDEFESFIEERGIVNKTEILAEFTSIGESGLSQVVSRSANVFNIDNGYYIHANQFDIQPEDYEQLRSYLNEVCENIPVNIRSVYETIADKYPDFFYRNDFDDRNKLFAALYYMFRGEFVFSRPYVAKLGASDISNRSVILQHIKDYDTIEIEELIDICEENNIDYLSPGYLCQSLAPDYLRINRTTMMRFELTGITNEVIDQTIEIVNEYLEVNDYIAGSKISDFLWYPSINIDWNAFLLESLVLNCKKIAVVNMLGDSLKHPNAIYVSSKYEKDTYDSFLIKLLKDEVHKGTFLSKVEIKEWLKEEGLIDAKLPKCIESTKYFYVSEKGVRCTVE